MIVAGISGTYEAAPTATTGKMSIENQAHENAEYGYFPWHVNPRGAAAVFAPANQLTNKPKPSFDATGQMKKKMKTTPKGDHAAAADAAKQQLAIEEAAHPFQSARTHALKVGSNELMDYSAPRQSGLSLGYHLFSSPPPPPPESEKEVAAWMVDVATLEAGDAAPEEMAGLSKAQKTKRRKDAQLLLRSNPNSLPSFIAEAKTLNDAAAVLSRAEDSLTEASERVANDVKALSGGDKSRVSMAINTGNFAREAVALHEKASNTVSELAVALDTLYKSLQAEGESARKAALGRMVEISDEVQHELEDIELRLTDHVLLGTAEEAERMANAPGPDGDRLRALQHQMRSLDERQRLQKAVLVQTARKAVAATDAHKLRMAKVQARLEKSEAARTSLTTATDLLDAALTPLTSKSTNFISSDAARTGIAKTDLKDEATAARAIRRLSSFPDFSKMIASEAEEAAMAKRMGGMEFRTVRQPTSMMASSAGWVAKLIVIKTTKQTLGLHLAMDDQLPSVVVDTNVLQRANEVSITKVLPKGKTASRRSNEKTYNLATGLVVIDPPSDDGPAGNGLVCMKDVLVAIDGKEVRGDRPDANPEVAKLLQLIAGEEEEGGPSETKMKTFVLTVLRPSYDGKPRKKGVVGRVARALIPFSKKK